MDRKKIFDQLTKFANAPLSWRLVFGIIAFYVVCASAGVLYITQAFKAPERPDFVSV